MSLNRFVLLIFLWALSAVGFFLLGRHSSETAPTQEMTMASFPSRNEPSPEVLPATRLDELERENAELKDKLERIQGEREKLGREYMELALKQALQGAGNTSPSGESVQATWNRGFDEYRRHDQRGLGAGLGRGVGLLFDMAQYGETGVFFLRDVVTNTQRSVRERELALNVLSLMHTKTALRVIMDLREPDIMELDYPYDLILPQLASLTSDEIAEYIPEINSQIAQDLEVDESGLAPERVDVLACLAFTHNNRDSLSLLYNPRAMQENLATALQLADENHSSPARQYVETAARDAREPYRIQASHMLQGW